MFLGSKKIKSAQMSEQTEEKVTKDVSQEFNRRDIYSGCPVEFGDFLLNPQVWVPSGSVPQTSQNFNGETKKKMRTVLKTICILKLVS